ncbi:hypothetical protein [Formosa sp. PL04]|uniref:hypothetical protein n=1 Tax=Formosa sp. PL04 TaxID=3081755 RepID=UPI00298108DC|nr:hypothetical protein [Formosa sp. PL04]MDW5290561.1 hypothetical protein [Formosa sp. PL04]
MNKILFSSNLLMGIILSRFAISKLAGWEISVQAFIEMAKPLGINPTVFRVTTGVLILAVVIGYLSTAVFSLIKNQTEITSKFSFINWATLANIFGLLTMTGALIAEFSLRVQPKWLLVYIAFGIIVLSTINLFILNTQKQLIITKK